MSFKKPYILIIYTGGTIGMVKDSINGSLRPLPFNHIMDEIPELSRAQYTISSHTFNPPIDSSNIDDLQWIKIAAIIEKNYYRFDGFVILHGTDTMAYSASALSFMLENLTKPVIFTGSQLPIGSLRTDAKENLISALEIAASHQDGKSMVPEVCVYFESKLFRGNRISKFNAEEFKAFQSYNYPPLAEFGVHIRYHTNNINLPDKKEKFRVQKEINTNVALLKIFPGISKSFVQAVLNTQGLRALVLETFGSGNAPSHIWFISLLKDALNKGIIILNVTQCAEGNVNMGMYETSIELEKAGVVSGRDITTEAAITKLMYLLGKNYSNSQICENLNISMRGEITL